MLLRAMCTLSLHMWEKAAGLGTVVRQAGSTARVSNGSLASACAIMCFALIRVFLEIGPATPSIFGITPPPIRSGWTIRLAFLAVLLQSVSTASYALIGQIFHLLT